MTVLPASLRHRSTRTILAAVGHDIRTPMHTILGMSELLSSTQLTGAQRQYLDALQRSARGLNALLDRLVSPDSTRSVAAERFYLSDTIDEAVELVAAQAARKQLQLVIEVAPDVPRHLVGDDQRIRGALLNLLTNAVKYTVAGVVTVRVRQANREGSRMTLQVSVLDTGPGIPADQHDRVFEPWFRLAATEHVPGDGLGLAIVHRLITSLHGKVRIESPLRPEGGCAFHLDIPVAIQPDPTRRSDDLHQALNGTRLLLIGPPLFVEQVERLLGRTDVDMVVADSMDTARALPAVDLYDVVIAHGRIAVDLVRHGGVSGRAIMAVLPRGHVIDVDDELGPAGVKTLLEPLRNDEFHAAMLAALAPTPVSSPDVDISDVLIQAADDSVDARDLLHHHLHNKVAELVIHPDGDHMLRALHHGFGPMARRVCLLIDLDMPGKNGFETARALASFGVPMVAMSAFEDIDVAEACVQAGFCHRLQKPFSPLELLRAIDSYAAPPPRQLDRLALRTELTMALAGRDYRAIELIAARMDAVSSAALMPHVLRRDDDKIREFVRSWSAPPAPLLPPAIVDEDQWRIEPGLEDLVATYLDRRQAELADIERHAQEGDFEQIAFLSHRMSGSGASFGMPVFTDIGRDMNIAAKERDVHRVRHNNDQLSKAIVSAREVLSKRR